MISYTDADFVRTAAFKRGEAVLAPPFSTLARWIAEEFGCEAPLNIEYEWCDLARSHRLQVIFEHEGTVEIFIDEIGNFDANKQAAVAARFRAQSEPDSGLDDFFVIFSAFEPVARWQVNDAISDRIPAIERAVSDNRVWRIHQQFGYATFFVHTDAQLDQLTDGERQRFRGAYMAKLVACDEFGYFRARPIELSFDSKERFERDFGGNWFLYDR